MPKAETEDVTVVEEADNTPKTVKIQLFKDRGDYKDDVFVCVNGRSYQIQRGIEVEVPDFIAEVIKTSVDQDRKTDELIEREKAKYQQRAKQIS